MKILALRRSPPTTADALASTEPPAAVSPLQMLRTMAPGPLLAPLLALLLAIVFFATQAERFLSLQNFSLILQQVMVVGVIAIGQTLIILTAGIDLSCGMVMAFGSIVMAKLAIASGMNEYLAILLGLAATVAFGLANGLLVTMVRLPSFIVTLGTMNIAFALTQIYSNSQTVTDLPPALTFLGNTFSLGGAEINHGTVLMLALYAGVWFALRNTAPGRHVYAVGNNPEAARLTGIATRRVLLGVYTSAGLLYGIASLLAVARTGVGDPQAGQTEALDAITAVVLGGTSLFGGRGVVIGSLIGALIVGVFRNGLTLMGVSSIYQILITGILVILAVSTDKLSHRKGY
jgi:fructose transport system permease protein